MADLADTIRNYEKSYKSMWADITRARTERDRALKLVDSARDLVVAFEHDLGSGLTKVSLQTHDAFNTLRSRLVDNN